MAKQQAWAIKLQSFLLERVLGVPPTLDDMHVQLAGFEKSERSSSGRIAELENQLSGLSKKLEHICVLQLREAYLRTPN